MIYVTIARKRQKDRFKVDKKVSLVMKVLWKGVTSARKSVMKVGKGYNNMDHMDKNI